jgi:hypothetical protein
MTNTEQVILNNIHCVANDENLSEKEALLVIMAIVEDRLANFGIFVEGQDPN